LSVPISPLVIAPGALHLPEYLTFTEQSAVAARCIEMGSRPVGFYTPIVRGKHPMSVRMMCLGKHWNARTYSYEDVRSDVDGRPAPELPEEFVMLAERAAKDAGFSIRPDLCIVNWYSESSRLGLHQDKDESPESLSEGLPVISFSIGDTARFLFGGVRRRDPIEPILLRSGDAFVFGGPARLRYHGVSRVLPDTAPQGLPFTGRLNLTFRKL